MQNTDPRTCLYCDRPADSREHIFPEGIGGRAPQQILCSQHNCDVGNKCDKPLIESLDLFVHMFRIRRKDGTHGISIIGQEASGIDLKITEDFSPQLAKSVEIIERTEDDRPSKIRATNIKAANKLIKSMNLPLDAVITTEHQAIPSPKINLDVTLGGAGAFRGILKIAYEFARGLLSGSITDITHDATIRAVLLDDADPMPFVKWLPYENIPGGFEATSFSSRIIAWQNDIETLAIVEFFNCVPFVVRLPGISIPISAIYVQDVSGGNPVIGTIALQIPWRFSDIPEHAQTELLKDFPLRFKPIYETYELYQIMNPVTNATGRRFVTQPDASDAEITHAVFQETNKLFGDDVASRKEDAIKLIIRMALAFLRGNQEKT